MQAIICFRGDLSPYLVRSFSFLGVRAPLEQLCESERNSQNQKVFGSDHLHFLFMKEVQEVDSDNRLYLDTIELQLVLEHPHRQ